MWINANQIIDSLDMHELPLYIARSILNTIVKEMQIKVSYGFCFVFRKIKIYSHLLTLGAILPLITIRSPNRSFLIVSVKGVR